MTDTTIKLIEYIIPIGTPYKAYIYDKNNDKDKPYNLYQEGHSLRSAIYPETDVSVVVGTEEHRKIFMYFNLPPEAAPLVILAVERKYIVQKENGSYKYCMNPDTNTENLWAQLNKKK